LLQSLGLPDDDTAKVRYNFADTAIATGGE